MNSLPPKIMIVEDAAGIARLLGKLFENQGVETILVTNVAEAKALLLDYSIFSQLQAVIIDLMLPGEESGERLIDFLLAIPVRPRIIIFSAVVHDREEKIFYSRGVSAVVRKPSDFPDLWLAVFPDSVVK